MKYGTEASWRTAIHRMLRGTEYEVFEKHLSQIPYLSLPIRKELLKIARCQRSLSRNSFLSLQTHSAHKHYPNADPPCRDRTGMTIRQLVSELSDGCHRDIAFSSILSVLARSAPIFLFDEREVEQNRIDSWEKEIMACVGFDRPQVLDYSVWFSDDPSAYKRSISEFLPPAPATNFRIRTSLESWKSSLRGHVFFPQVQTRKTVSRLTAYTLRESSGIGELFDKDVTTADLEKWYMETGVEIQGPCEIRQAWKYNDLTPRSYFAQGGTAFHASKYIREIVNSLANTFPETHFISRFSIASVDVDSESTAFIYDLTSFTSNLTEYKYFLEGLAQYTDDVEVFIVDSNSGVLRTSLGSLIRDYNDTCNRQGVFTVNRYIEGSWDLVAHNKSGFLGVYGNIAGSTVLHGLHTCNLCGDDGGCRCVGDDVYGAIRLSKEFDKQDMIAAIQSIGTVHPAKVRFWDYKSIDEVDEADDDHAWPYTKRPLDRLENRMILEQSLALPIFGLMFPIYDGIHVSELDGSTISRKLAMQVYSLIRQVRTIHPPLRMAQKSLLSSYLRVLYRHLGLSETGALPFESIVANGFTVNHCFLPPCTEGMFDEDPWSSLEERFIANPNPIVVCPVTDSQETDVFAEVLQHGFAEGRVGRKIAYLEKLGLVETEPLYRERFFESFLEYRDFYEQLFGGFLVKSYKIRLIRRVPWLSDLLSV